MSMKGTAQLDFGGSDGDHTAIPTSICDLERQIARLHSASRGADLRGTLAALCACLARRALVSRVACSFERTAFGGG